MNAAATCMNDALQRKVILSSMEADDLVERDLLCPYCDFRIQTIYSDAVGHLRSKCPKCKNITIFNLAYFRRMKHRPRYRHSAHTGRVYR